MDETPRRLTRTRNDRVFGGVCGGLGRYFNVDPTIFRIGAVVLLFVGGAGALAYFVAWLLVPAEDAPGEPAAPHSGWVIALLVLVGLFFGLPLFFALLFAFGAIIIPAAFAIVAGVLVWWLATGEGPGGSAGEVVKRAVFGMILLALCAAIALAGAWATAAGGETVVAILVIAAGALIVAGAFLRPVRWLILPAVILALSAGTTAAAGVDLDGGMGERDYRPTSAAEVRERYELGAGTLTLDLSLVDFPAGDVPIEIDVGVGDVLVILKDSDVCAGLDAKVGIGEARLYKRSSAGVDVDFREVPEARATTPRILISGDIGVGELRVRGNGVGGGPFDANRRCLDTGQNAAR